MKKTQDAKKAYAAPKLTKLGDVKELTQSFVPIGSGPIPLAG